jgi:putative thioredoxin
MDSSIIEVSEATFEYEVIAHSNQVPVVVDFWAPWCGPCRTLGPMLERLAREANGAFRLAKVNVDENPRLATRFGVQGIPAVKAFKGGQEVSQFVGAQPESMVQRFVRELAPRAADRALVEARGFLVARHWPEAEEAAQRALTDDPGSSAAALCLVKALLAQGKGAPALEVMDAFPGGNEVVAAERLRPLAQLMLRAAEASPANGDPTEAEYLQSVRLIARGNFAGALDGLLDVLRRDKHYAQDQARQVFLAVLELMGEEDPLTRAYREELASALF